MQLSLPESWQPILITETSEPYFYGLMDFINSEYSQYVCFPQENNIFRVLDMTPFDDVKVVILGQDPYHTSGAAM